MQAAARALASALDTRCSTSATRARRRRDPIRSAVRPGGPGASAPCACGWRRRDLL